MKHYLSLKPIGIFALLFPMLLLPMLHLHPAYEHRLGEASGHQHQSALHADFFPDAAHGDDLHDDHSAHAGDVDFSVNSSAHTLSQIDLHSLHIGQSFQLSSVFKRKPLALDQVSFDLSIFPNFQRGVPEGQHPPPPQTPRFSPPSLRAPPYFA